MNASEDLGDLVGNLSPVYIIQRAKRELGDASTSH